MSDKKHHHSLWRSSEDKARYFALRAQHSVADMRKGAPSACIADDNAEKMEESELLIPLEIHVPVSGTTLSLTDNYNISIHNSL